MENEKKKYIKSWTQTWLCYYYFCTHCWVIPLDISSNRVPLVKIIKIQDLTI